MIKKNKIYIIVLIVASVLILTGTAYAYFTDSISHEGAISFSFTDDKPQLTTTKSGNTVNITVRNPKNVSVYVRLTSYSTMGLRIASTSNNVIPTNGYYYYDEPLAPGQTTETISFNYTLNDVPNLKTAIVAEIIDASYDSNGDIYSSWDEYVE